MSCTSTAYSFDPCSLVEPKATVNFIGGAMDSIKHEVRRDCLKTMQVMIYNERPFIHCFYDIVKENKDGTYNAEFSHHVQGSGTRRNKYTNQ